MIKMLSINNRVFCCEGVVFTNLSSSMSQGTSQSQGKDGTKAIADRWKGGHGRRHDITSQQLGSPAHNLHEHKPVKIPASIAEGYPRPQTHQKSYWQLKTTEGEKCYFLLQMWVLVSCLCLS